MSVTRSERFNEKGGIEVGRLAVLGLAIVAVCAALEIHPSFIAADETASTAPLQNCGGAAQYTQKGSSSPANEGQLSSKLGDDVAKLQKVGLETGSEMSFPNHIGIIASENNLVVAFPTQQWGGGGSDNLTFDFYQGKPETISPGAVVCTDGNNIYATAGFVTIHHIAQELNSVKN